jgi:hypothetical protein
MSDLFRLTERNESVGDSPPERAPRIITFYSYKGGTGRSLAVAHVAWILADNGKKVFVIDWDLEAPGLHRYFHPFLDDKHLSDSPGLIDYLNAFVEGSRFEAANPSAGAVQWFDRYVDFFPYAMSLRGYEFRNGGGLDFMPAGRQDSGYSAKVTSFDWGAFYEKLGGGVFLEAFKSELRKHYDYVLIDSRTGISDTAGICTVQMPDDLVICFTYNNQSMRGAEAVARSAMAQRRRPSGKRGLRVWPVPTRVDLSEQARLDAARTFAQRTFKVFLSQLAPADRRQRYWDRIEVPYTPYLAYEEILAQFADSHRSNLSVLASLAALTSELTDGMVTEVPPIANAEREVILRKFERYNEPTSSKVHKQIIFLTGSLDHRKMASLHRTLMEKFAGRIVWRDDDVFLSDNQWLPAFKPDCAVLVLDGTDLEGQQKRIQKTVGLGAYSLMIVLSVPKSGKLNQMTRNTYDENSNVALFFMDEIDDKGICDKTVGDLAIEIERLLLGTSKKKNLNPDDPQKGRWGGRAESNGLLLRAKVEATGDEDWFDIELGVCVTGQRTLSGQVVFHLHDTFENDRIEVPVKDNSAVWRTQGWGAFTVGAEADEGRTRLELDLSKIEAAPKRFREN